jgi:hypothetical protein
MADNSIKVLITGDGAQLSKALNTASSQIQSFGRKASASLSAFGRGLSVLGVGGAAGLAAGIKRSVDAMDDLYKASQKAGVSVEVLSKLRYAADLSGVEAQGLDNALRFLNKSLAEGAKGTKEYAEALAAVGVGPADSAAEALLKIADAFSKMPDGAEKTALALKLFGKSGTEMIPLLNAGAAGISKMTDEAKRLGLEISTNTAKQAEAFNDNITRLAGAIRGPFNEALAAALPSLESFSNRLVAVSQASGGLAGVLEGLGKRLGLGLLITQTRNELDGLKKDLADLRAKEAAGDFPLFGGTASLYTQIAETEKAIERVEQKLVRLRERAGELQTQTPAVDVAIEGAPDAAQKVTQDAVAASQAAQAAVPPIIVPMAVSPVGALGSYADLKQEFLRQQVPGNAAGGLISGPGTGTSDSILSWLSKGEYVMRASAVNHYGAELMRAINSMSLPKFASGGQVSMPIYLNNRYTGTASASSSEAGAIMRAFRKASTQRAPR